MRILREHEPYPVLLREEKSLLSRTLGKKQQPAHVPVLSRFVWDPELN